MFLIRCKYIHKDSNMKQKLPKSKKYNYDYFNVIVEVRIWLQYVAYFVVLVSK